MLLVNSYQQLMGDPVFLYPYQHLALLLFYILSSLIGVFLYVYGVSCDVADLSHSPLLCRITVKSWPLALFPILGESIYSVTIKYNVSCGFFVDILYYIEEFLLYSYFFSWDFIMNVYSILSKAFSESVHMIMWGFFSLLCGRLHWLIFKYWIVFKYSISFAFLGWTFLVMVCNSFYILLNSMMLMFC